MNRADRRRSAKRINTPQKLERFSEELERRIRMEYEQDYKKRVYDFIENYTILTAYVLNYKAGFGRKRLPKIMEDINKHIEMLSEGYISLEDCKNELKRVGVEFNFNKNEV